MARAVPSAERTLMQQINHALAPRAQRLKKLRGDRWRSQLGDISWMSFTTRLPPHVDPVPLAQQLGLVAPGDGVAHAREQRDGAPQGPPGPQTPRRRAVQPVRRPECGRKSL